MDKSGLYWRSISRLGIRALDSPRYRRSPSRTLRNIVMDAQYIKTSPADARSSSLALEFFESQAHVLTGHFDPTRRSPRSREDIHYQPHAGRPIVFPGRQVASTNPSLAGSKNPEESEAETPLDRQRISLGFNFRQRKKGDRPEERCGQSNRPRRPLGQTRRWPLDLPKISRSESRDSLFPS